LLERPPEQRSTTTPWPLWPLMFRSSSSHDEGGTREYAVLTQYFEGENGRVKRLHAVHVQFGEPDPRGAPKMEEIEGSQFTIDADLVLLAMGFVHPVHEGLLDGLGVQQDGRGNVRAETTSYATSEPGFFAAGDCRRGQSLVVWAISEGREAARAVDVYLEGGSSLQSKQAYI